MGMKLFIFFFLFFQNSYANDCSSKRIELNQKMDSAEQILDSAININSFPNPPSAEFNCLGAPKETRRDTHQNAQASMYNSQLNNTELSAIHSFDSLQPSAELCGFSADINDISQKLANRMTIKANLNAERIRASGNFNQYLGAIDAVIESARLLEALGGNRSARAYQLAGDMYIDLADYSIDQIRTNHDFRFDLSVLTEFVRRSTALGHADVLETYIRKFEKVLKFEVMIEGKSNILVEDFEVDYMTNMINPSLSASYNFEWSSFDWQPTPMTQKIEGKLDVDDGYGKLIGNLIFNNPVVLDIRACDMVPYVKVKMMEFGPSKESWLICDDEDDCNAFAFPTTLKAVATHALSGQYRYEMIRGAGPYYSFELPLQNLNSEIGNRTYIGEKQMDEMEFKSNYQFKVLHTP